MAAPSPARASVAKGLIDVLLEAEPAESTARAGMIREIDRGLGTHWVRVVVDWSRLEPTRGSLRAGRGRAPRRPRRRPARRRRQGRPHDLLPARLGERPYWWSHPPAGYAEGPQAFYPIRDGALGDYRDLAEFLARRYKGRAQALECWNEPNLWPYIYPQRTAGDPYFAARVYLRMLKAFHAGVARAHTGVRVVAGATAPVGLDDTYRTSPQRFARFLRRAGAGRFFDVYSHHPYTPGGSIYTAPDQPPNDPSNTVTLFNLRTLLRLFPSKPFYLTEYGYNTQPNRCFGIFVGEPVQARYLTARVPLRGALPTGQAARVVPGPRLEAGLGARRPRRLHGLEARGRLAQAGLVRVPASLSPAREAAGPDLHALRVTQVVTRACRPSVLVAAP